MFEVMVTIGGNPNSVKVGKRKTQGMKMVRYLDGECSEVSNSPSFAQFAA